MQLIVDGGDTVRNVPRLLNGNPFLISLVISWRSLPHQNNNANNQRVHDDGKETKAG